MKDVCPTCGYLFDAFSVSAHKTQAGFHALSSGMEYNARLYSHKVSWSFCGRLDMSIRAAQCGCYIVGMES